MLRVPEHFPPQSAERMDQAPAIKRVDPQVPPGFQQPDELRQRSSALLERLGYTQAKDPVEMLGPERKTANIGYREDGADQFAGDSFAKRRQRIVDANDLVSVTQEDSGVGPGSAARVKPPPGLAGFPETEKSSNPCIQTGRGPSRNAGIVVAKVGKLLEPGSPLILEPGSQRCFSSGSSTRSIRPAGASEAAR